MASYQQFIFDSYAFSPETGELALRYSLDDQLDFLETYRFDFDFTDYDPEALDRALQTLFFIAGVSYYKTYLPDEIIVKHGEIDQPMADFLSYTYQRGLGEFWFVNQLDPRTPVTFPVNTDRLAPARNTGQGMLVGVGGGKDSLLTIEMLRGQGQQLTTWSLGHRPQLTPLVEEIGLPHLWVERTWDRQLLALKETPGTYHGHIPISAIFAAVGTVVAILSGKHDVIVSNEQSANEPTLQYQGIDINHQYSKSQAYELAFQQHLLRTYGETVQYYSFLRPLSEVYIAELFSRIGFDKYRDTFSSCNRAFVHTSDRMSWCGHCPKCAFVFLALTPFLPPDKLTTLWGGKNLLHDPELEPLYRSLLGIEGDKPLDCVGEVKESRAAMRNAQALYPELAEKYTFDIPASYDYRALGSHQMPQDAYSLFAAAFAQLATDQ